MRTLRRAAPPPPATDELGRRRVHDVVDATQDDALAAFALRRDKAHVFSPDGKAAVGYQVRFGTAVASGDPVGRPESRPAAIAAFLDHARANHWRVAVLAASEEALPWWQPAGLRAVRIGRDVVLDAATFEPVGRQYRNLRQAVARSHNAGVTTEITEERELSPAVVAELLDVVRSSGRSVEQRGFAMILDGLLDAVHPGTFIAVARNRDGRAVAFQRFVAAGGCRDLALDVPYRCPESPNGTDERLAMDVVEWAREHDVERVSLAFAPFPDLFAARDPSLPQRLGRRATRLFDPVIRLESLYRYLRKFRAFGARRYVGFVPTQIVPAVAAMLALEFSSGAPAAGGEGAARSSVGVGSGERDRGGDHGGAAQRLDDKRPRRVPQPVRQDADAEEQPDERLAEGQAR